MATDEQPPREFRPRHVSASANRRFVGTRAARPTSRARRLKVVKPQTTDTGSVGDERQPTRLPHRPYGAVLFGRGQPKPDVAACHLGNCRLRKGHCSVLISALERMRPLHSDSGRTLSRADQRAGAHHGWFSAYHRDVQVRGSDQCGVTRCIGWSLQL